MSLSTQRPNPNNHIGLLYETITSETLNKDPCIDEISELTKEPKFYLSFSYALYADHSMVQENIFWPIFHTYSLCSNNKIVIIRSESMTNMLPIYPYHHYVIYKDQELFDKLKAEFPQYKISHTTCLKEFINEL